MSGILFETETYISDLAVKVRLERDEGFVSCICGKWEREKKEIHCQHGSGTPT